ncbi:MAG: hypothetical protein EHM38_06095 [Geobacteraceae bacterium]|nr:MAG: hypothetical protein EHM38_06095 [Geobacteraceae bacterium]RPJ12070.1 MAG: hypothetical protein EHM37_09865 [Deltaproteobacteria bacterium]
MNWSGLVFISGDDLVAAVADRQQIVEPQPEEVVPAVAFNEVVLVRVVAAGAFTRKIGIAADEGFGVLEVTHRDDRVHCVRIGVCIFIDAC